MEQVPAGARCPRCGAVRPPDAVSDAVADVILAAYAAVGSDATEGAEVAVPTT